MSAHMEAVRDAIRISQIDGRKRTVLGHKVRLRDGTTYWCYDVYGGLSAIQIKTVRPAWRG